MPQNPPACCDSCHVLDDCAPEALKRALLAAKSIGHTAPSGGGITAALALTRERRLATISEIARYWTTGAGIEVTPRFAQMHRSVNLGPVLDQPGGRVGTCVTALCELLTPS